MSDRDPRAIGEQLNGVLNRVQTRSIEQRRNDVYRLLAGMDYMDSKPALIQKMLTRSAARRLVDRGIDAEHLEELWKTDCNSGRWNNPRLLFFKNLKDLLS